MTVVKPKPKQLLRPITSGAGSAMNQSQFLAITCNSLEAREKSRVHGTIGFAFASHWLKNWRDSFKPITKRSNRNHVISTVIWKLLHSIVGVVSFVLRRVVILLFLNTKLHKKKFLWLHSKNVFLCLDGSFNFIKIFPAKTPKWDTS